jgi:SAM-dependent methyltransferase
LSVGLSPDDEALNWPAGGPLTVDPTAPSNKAGRYSQFIRTHKLASVLAVCFVACTFLLIAVFVQRQLEGRDTRSAEVERLMDALHVHEGESIAEIGAGDGTMTLPIARKVGPGGRVWANEIDPERVRQLRERAAEAGLANLAVVQGSDTNTRLPDGCCELVFMRFVYHHFSRPTEMNKSLYTALTPNGRLVIVDFTPRLRHELKLRVLRLFGRGHPDEVREGIPEADLRKQVTTAGFVFERRIDHWPGMGYCLVFDKGNSTPNERRP